MAGTSTIRDLLERLETKILDAPDLDVQLATHISGTQTDSQQRRHRGVAFARESTTVEFDGARNAHRSLVEDVVAVEYSRRIAPKAQRTSRNAAYDDAEKIRQRLTDLHDPALAPFAPVHIDTTETYLPSDLEPEWIVVLIRLSLRRFEPVGDG